MADVAITAGKNVFEPSERRVVRKVGKGIYALSVSTGYKYVVAHMHSVCSCYHTVALDHRTHNGLLIEAVTVHMRFPAQGRLRDNYAGSDHTTLHLLSNQPQRRRPSAGIDFVISCGKQKVSISFGLKSILFQRKQNHTKLSPGTS